MKQSHVSSSHHAVVRSLDLLGLDEDALHQAIRFGELHRNSCTANDPANLPGLLTWGRTTRGLRELLAPRGWYADRLNKLEVAMRRDGRVAVVVGTGDAMTGIYSVDAGMDWRDREPRSKYPKGPATLRAVLNNQRAPRFDFAAVTAQPSRGGIVVATWVLLVAVDEHEIRAELSLPKSVDEENYVDAWHERIILEPIIRDPDGERLGRDDEHDEESDIDVKVRRRA